MVHPWTNSGDGGISFGSPLGAPASPQAALVSIWACVSDRLFSNFSVWPSSNQGGMARVTTIFFIIAAQGRASSYVNMEKGVPSPGRWQLWQFCCRIGATSLVKVRFEALVTGRAAESGFAMPAICPNRQGAMQSCNVKSDTRV